MQAKVQSIIAALEAAATPKFREEMSTRYGIVTDRAFGAPMAAIQSIARPHHPDHALAEALWETGWYEARIACAYIDDPRLVTPAQMDRWRADFDNWAIVDSLCFSLFDRTPHAFDKVDDWSALEDEFGRRAAFALLACLALHRKDGPDEPFLDGLALIERRAGDGRNFVSKAQSWALRAIGQRRSPALKAAALDLAQRLCASNDKAARWVGKDALRALAKPVKAKSSQA